MRVDLTDDEIDLLVRLTSACDDADPPTTRVAKRLERYLRRKLTQAKRWPVVG